MIQVPNHIREENNNKKQREINHGGTHRSLAPVQLLTDSTNVAHPSDEDALGEDKIEDNKNDNDNNGNNNNNNNNNNNKNDSDSSRLDFGPVEPVDSSTLLPPLFIPDHFPTLPPPLTKSLPTSSSTNQIPAPQGSTNEVDHSKLQRMFALSPAKAEMGQTILQACSSSLLNLNLQCNIDNHSLYRCLLQIGKLPWSMLPYPTNQLEILLIIGQVMITMKT